MLPPFDSISRLPLASSSRLAASFTDPLQLLCRKRTRMQRESRQTATKTFDMRRECEFEMTSRGDERRATSNQMHELFIPRLVSRGS